MRQHEKFGEVVSRGRRQGNMAKGDTTTAEILGLPSAKAFLSQEATDSILTDGSVAYRERDGGLWGMPPGRIRTSLSGGAILTIVEVTGIPLGGYEHLPN